MAPSAGGKRLAADDSEPQVPQPLLGRGALLPVVKIPGGWLSLTSEFQVFRDVTTIAVMHCHRPLDEAALAIEIGELFA